MTPKTIAYISVSTDKQGVSNQRLEILDYSRRNDLKVDEIIEIEVSSRKCQKERRIEELMNLLNLGDILIVSELLILGWSR